jgi:hypothetical protein
MTKLGLVVADEPAEDATEQVIAALRAGRAGEAA